MCPVEVICTLIPFVIVNPAPGATVFLNGSNVKFNCHMSHKYFYSSPIIFGYFTITQDSVILSSSKSFEIHSKTHCIKSLNTVIIIMYVHLYTLPFFHIILLEVQTAD